MRFVSEIKCRHDSGFMCLDVGTTYAFFCFNLCGFNLNFSPDNAGKYRTHAWTVRTVAFTPGPGARLDGVEWKQPEKLIPSLK